MLYTFKEHSPHLPTDFAGWLAPTAQLIGNVSLEQDVSVWFGAVIRGDNDRIHIGKGSNVQENSVIHTDVGIPVTIGSNVTIGHMAMLHGCEVGDNSLIGIGAVVLNHAKIGKNCIIGAKSLVTEGKVIPDNSLVMGSPAKVVKTLSDEQIVMLQHAAEHYVQKAKEFAQTLTPFTPPSSVPSAVISSSIMPSSSA